MPIFELKFLSNTPQIVGYTTKEHLGLVQGIAVRSLKIGKSFKYFSQHIKGGSQDGYKKLIEDARHDAFLEMVQKAKLLGANSIVNIRYSSSTVMPGLIQFIVYGTAVVIMEDN